MVDGLWAKPTIVGQLVTLRPFVPDDIDAAWEMVNDAEGNDLTATDEVFAFEQIDDWYRSRNDADGRLDLAIIENKTDQWAGEVVLNEYEPDTQQASFRISLRGPAWYGRGIGTEATELIVTHGFENVGLQRIVLEVLARNPRARRAYEKAGFQTTGTSFEDGEDWVHMARHSSRRGAADSG